MNAPVSGGGDFERHLIEPGTYPARLVWIIGLGTQESIYNGQVKHKKQIKLGFELPTELLPESHPRKGEPCFISKTFTYHMGSQSNLRPFIESWRGKNLTDGEAESFAVDKMLKAAAVLTIKHKVGKVDTTKIYAEIDSITSETAFRKNFPQFAVPTQVNKEVYFDVQWLLLSKEGAEYGLPKFNELPKYDQETVMKSQEWAKYTQCPWYVAPVLKGNTPSAPSTTQPPATQPAPKDSFDAIPSAMATPASSQEPPLAQPTVHPGTPEEWAGTNDADGDFEELPF